jgi:hypothetical protein
MVPESDTGWDTCGHTETDVGTISTTGGGLCEMFDVRTNCGSSGDDTAGSSDIGDVFHG